jgi:hypothetical protein
MAIPPDGQLKFKVYRQGALLGEHVMMFDRRGSELSVETRVDIVFKLGPVTVLRYGHHATERWTDGRFDSLSTHTISNGKTQAVEARRTDTGLLIRPAEGASYSANADTLPLTHWNRKMMDAPLFNPQDGKMLRERAMPKGPDSVQLVDGRVVAATRYALIGESQIDDWYDAAGEWIALRGKVKDGSLLEYRRI